MCLPPWVNETMKKTRFLLTKKAANPVGKRSLYHDREWFLMDRPQSIQVPNPPEEGPVISAPWKPGKNWMVFN